MPDHTHLDEPRFAEWLETIARFDASATSFAPRTYPGYPRHQLAKIRSGIPHSLDDALRARRCNSNLSPKAIDPHTLSRILFFAHGITGDAHRGPVPSAGGLQAVELYLAPLAEGWLPSGSYHYDRAGHFLSRLDDGAAWAAYLNTLSRYVSIKEEQTHIAKEELLVLWTDYFKPHHLEAYPDLHNTFWKAAKLCSAVKVEVNLAHAEEMMETIEKIHGIFWATKGRDVTYYTAS